MSYILICQTIGHGVRIAIPSVRSSAVAEACLCCVLTFRCVLLVRGQISLTAVSLTESMEGGGRGVEVNMEGVGTSTNTTD